MGAGPQEAAKRIPLEPAERGGRNPWAPACADHRDQAEALRSPEGVTRFRTYVPLYVLARARVLKVGRRLAYGEIHLLMADGGEKLVAHATSSYALPDLEANGAGPAGSRMAG